MHSLPISIKAKKHLGGTETEGYDIWWLSGTVTLEWRSGDLVT